MALNLTNSVSGAASLTNYNSVASNTGFADQCADFGTSNTNKKLEAASEFGIGSGNVSLAIRIQSNLDIGTGVTAIPVVLRTGASGLSYTIRYQNISGTRSIRFYRTRLGIVDVFQGYTYTIPTTSFVNMVLTYDGSTVRGYIEGTQVVSFAASGTGNASTSLYGLGAFTTLFYTSAMIDEAAVWNKALSAAEVTELNSGAIYPFSGSLATGLVSHYAFKDSETVTNFFPFLVAHS